MARILKNTFNSINVMRAKERKNETKKQMNEHKMKFIFNTTCEVLCTCREKLSDLMDSRVEWIRHDSVWHTLSLSLDRSLVQEVPPRCV